MFQGIFFLVMRLVSVMEFFDVLVRYEVALWSAIEHELGQRGLIRLGHLHALRVVERYRGKARVQDLSAEIGITVGAASKLVDRLERDGLASRAPNPTNRRSSLIVLTEAGQEALTSSLQVCARSLARAVGDEDTKALTAALDRLQRRLHASGPGVAA